MAKTRLNTLACILKGLVSSILLTLIFMLLLSLAVVYLNVEDSALTWLNQLVKILAIIFGVGISVGRGGENGFITGMTLAIIYMIIGYALYVFLGGNVFNAVSMLGEILIGAAIGSVTGAIFANMQPSRGRKKK